MTDPLRVAKDCTAALPKAAGEVERLSRDRSDAVKALLADGWSMGRLATELGVSKAAVQKMAR